MKQDIEKKLGLLRETYTKNLPEKMNELSQLEKTLKQNWNKDDLIVLHRKVHSLHGSALIFGHPELGNFATEVESHISKFLQDNDPTTSQKNQMYELLKQLREIALNSSTTKPTEKISNFKKEITKVLYIYDNDETWIKNCGKQLENFSFVLKDFNNIKMLNESLQKVKPCALLINIDLINNDLEKILLELKQDNEGKSIPIFILANSSEFSLRLKAVRLGAQAFIIKPFLIEDLILLLDRLLNISNEPYRVLIVDDEPDVASYHSTILEGANMVARVVNHSKDVDKALHDFRPEIILMDLYMPDCSGLELAAIIRQQSAYESIPIIFLSSEEDRLKQLHAMQLGGDDFITKSTQPNYLIMTIRNRANRYKTLRSMIIKDNLTGVYNHSHTMRQLEIELKSAMALHNPLSVAMLDIDNFKRINDTYGHMSGDQVLRSLCLMMQSRLRTTDIVGRYGGEEFLILFPNTDIETAKKILDDLRNSFQTLNFNWNNQIYNSTFSAGIASYPEFNTSESIIQAADETLYKAKKSGRNTVEVKSI